MPPRRLDFDNWPELTRLLDEALELPADARARWLDELALQRTGLVTVACVPSTTAHFLPSVLRRFHLRFPRIRVRLHDAHAHEALGAVGADLERMWGDDLWRLRVAAELAESRRGPQPGTRRRRRRPSRRSPS